MATHKTGQRTRRGIAGIAAVAGGVLAAASVAFACTVAPPSAYSTLPESATPGANVVVNGEDISSKAPVEIRWNGAKGELLGVGAPTSGAFSVPVKIPDVSPGVYSLSLVAADGRVGRIAMDVTGAAASAPASKPWPTTASRPSLAASESSGPSTAGIALLAVGLVGLFAGSAVAVTSRRRVPSGADK